MVVKICVGQKKKTVAQIYKACEDVRCCKPRVIHCVIKLENTL